MGGIDLGSVKAKIEGDTSGLEESVGRAKGVLDGFSASAVGMGAAIGAGFAVVNAAGELITELANGVLEAGRAMADAVVKVAEFSEHLTNLSMVTGLSVDALQSMGKAAVESGTSADSFINTITRMETKLGTGTKQVQEAVSALGLSWKELSQSSPEEAVRNVSAALVQMTDVAERNAIAQKLGVRSLQDALPAMQAYIDAGDRYVNLSNAQIAAGLEMDRSLDELKTSWAELWQQIGATLNTPEVREGIKELAQAIRNITIAVKDGSGPVAGFFKSIAEHANNAAKWVVFLGGAFDGLKERLASASKDTPGAIAAGMKALDAFDARVNADKNKQWGKEMFPTLFEPKTTLGALGDRGEGAAEVKKLQAEIDKLSGTKAQAEVNLISTAVSRLGIDGVANVDALGKRLVQLGAEGAKVPDQLMGTWTDAFIKQASKVGSQGESLKKQIAGIYKENSKTISDTLKRDEEAARQYEKTRVFIDKEAEDQIRAQLRDGTLSVKEQYALRRDEIVASTQTQIDQIRRLAAATTDPAQLAALEALIAEWERIADKELHATIAAERYAQVTKTFGDLGNILAGVSDVFDAIGISVDSAVGKIVGGMQTAVSAVQNFASQTTTAGRIGAGLSAAASVYKTGQEKGAMAGVTSGALTGAGIGFAVGGPAGAAVGAVAGIVTGLVGALRKPEYKKIMSDVGKSWGVNISEGLAKEIEQLAKQNKISRSLAELLDVSKVMGESGKDPRTFSRQIGDLMNAIKSGAVPAAQGMEELGRAFNMVADAAVKSGTVGDRALVSLIKRARELGEVTPEMKAFVGAQLDNAIAGIHKYVAAIEQITKAAKATPEELSKIGATSGVVFGAMFDAMVSERGIVGAVDAMKDDYAKLHETLMSTLGPDAVNAILGPFGGAFATISDESLRPIFEGIDGITQAMTGLANAGYLSVDQFGAMQDATAQLFDQAIAGGADTRTALLAVAPGIQAAISAAEQFGVPLDADMARLKAMAEQNGITFKTDPQAAMLDVLVSIAEVLGAQVPESARRASAAMNDLANSVPRDLNVNVNVNRNYSDNYGCLLYTSDAADE